MEMNGSKVGGGDHEASALRRSIYVEEAAPGRIKEGVGGNRVAVGIACAHQRGCRDHLSLGRRDLRPPVYPYTTLFRSHRHVELSWRTPLHPIIGVSVDMVG